MKKGISAVVATVLIILITVAAITIIWAAIIPMIRENITGGNSCMEAQADLTLGSSGYTCYTCHNLTGAKIACSSANANYTNISLQIGHGPKTYDLAGVQVLIHIGGNTKTKNLAKTDFANSNFPGQNQMKVVYINSTEYNNASKVDIAPIIQVGNTQKNCGISQSAVLTECSA